MADEDPRWRVGSAAWDPALAAAITRRLGVADEARRALVEVELSLAPATPQWLGDRFTVLSTQFAINRGGVDPDIVTIWMEQMMRLFAEVPQDILATAIDAAILSVDHGFIPSAGEIMKHARPKIEERQEMATRMRSLAAALGASAENPVGKGEDVNVE